MIQTQLTAKNNYSSTTAKYKQKNKEIKFSNTQKQIHKDQVSFSGIKAPNKRKVAGFLGSIIMTLNLVGCTSFKKTTNEEIFKVLGKENAIEFLNKTETQLNKIKKNNLEQIDTYYKKPDKDTDLTKLNIEELYEEAKKECQNNHNSRLDSYDTTTTIGITDKGATPVIVQTPVYKFYDKSSIEPVINLEVGNDQKSVRFEVSSYGK